MCKKTVCDSGRVNAKYHIEVEDYLAQQAFCRSGCKASTVLQNSKNQCRNPRQLLPKHRERSVVR